MKERRGNVTENKGSRLDNRAKSGNVAENKDGYALKGGMLVKRQLVSGC
jgi:hypothetical protein